MSRATHTIYVGVAYVFNKYDKSESKQEPREFQVSYLDFLLSRKAKSVRQQTMTLHKEVLGKLIEWLD
jgi:hypothetical protein